MNPMFLLPRCVCVYLPDIWRLKVLLYVCTAGASKSFHQSRKNGSSKKESFTVVETKVFISEEDDDKLFVVAAEEDILSPLPTQPFFTKLVIVTDTSWERKAKVSMVTATRTYVKNISLYPYISIYVPGEPELLQKRV